MDYAHSLPGRPTTEWESLEKHLADVADPAGTMAQAFNARDWGRVAGLWHDLGKLQSAFQHYLKRENGIDEHEADVATAGKVDHSTPGAQHAMSVGGAGRRLMAHVIAGHHAGLMDESCDGDSASLRKRLAKGAADGLQPLQEVPSYAQAKHHDAVPDGDGPESPAHAGVD